MKPAPAAEAIARAGIGALASTLIPTGQPQARPDPVGRDRHVGRHFGADVAGLREGHVAVVLDDDAVEPAFEIGARVGQGALVDGVDASPS